MSGESQTTIGRSDLPGILSAPSGATGLVIFAHGSGSSRFSPRNRHAADLFNRAGLATLLFDLLTEEEAEDRANVFDIELLGARVAEAIDWAADDPRVRGLPIGLFGASTGAAAAIVAAAARQKMVAAVVSRGGRPDLAGAALRTLKAPILLIVGGEDLEVLALNQAAMAKMGCETAIEIVPGAVHLFEEPGTLDQALNAARRWFERRLRPGPHHLEKRQ